MKFVYVKITYLDSMRTIFKFHSSEARFKESNTEQNSHTTTVQINPTQ